MLIRCEKCQALFSLQDGVVRGAQGEIPPAFAVECGRCLSTFQAEAPASLLPSSTRKTPSPPIAPLARAGKPKPSGATERAMQGAPTSQSLARALKPNRPAEADDDEFTRELARIARRRRTTIWIAGAIVLAVIAALILPLVRKQLSSLPHAARQKLELSHQKLLLDDPASLEEAADLAQQAVKLAPGEARPQGEAAFALLLEAGSHKDLADRGEAKATLLGDEMAKLQIAHPDGFEKQVDALRTQMLQINEEREPHVHAASELTRAGHDLALAALEADPDEPSALRAMVIFDALKGAVDTGQSYADRADSVSPNDPLNAYARAQLWLSGSPSNEKQDKALAQLALVQKATPHMLRALYDIAAVEAERQLNAPAREKLDKLLAENPAHLRARLLRASLGPAAP